MKVKILNVVGARPNFVKIAPLISEMRMGNATVPAVQGAPARTGQRSESRYAVLTLHRQGLVDDPVLFGKIWEALQEISCGIPIIFPVHPRTELRLRGLGFESSPGNCNGNSSGGIQMIPPLGYLEFLSLQKQAALVLTDSGGVQEETTVLGVPCLTLRENTERPFTVTHGTNKVVGLDPDRIRYEVGRLLQGDVRQSRDLRLWDGRTAERIVRILREHLGTVRESRRDHAEPVLPAWVESAGTP